MMIPLSATERFRAARDFLLAHRDDYATACRTFEWPALDEFNWALDWFDAVAEAAVIPSPDPLRLAVPKAYVTLAAGHAPDAATAYAILAYAREHLAPYKRVRRIEFGALPKTISGQIRRVELRTLEETRHGTTTAATRAPHEYGRMISPI